MVKKIGIGLAAVIAALCAVIAMQPDKYAVTRSATIPASPDVVFSQINDFTKWNDWSPWAKLDPNMKTTITPNPAGKGARYDWVGNSDVGCGSMTILDSKPNESVRIDLEFVEPFASKALTNFTLTPDGAGTKVEWAMSGENNFMGKAFSLFMNMDKMIGADFEKGLSQLQTAVKR
ncbi:MAG: SRPBCC family protein [Acidobacteria bacterium]|nr:SRPBCC family protein [Acidobacteriota bacterium]